MIDIIKYGNFKPLGKQKKKSQIILTHTSRNVENYLASLRYRYNGTYKRIPNYIITKEGKVLQLLENIEHTEFFSEINLNRNSIIVSLENLGWLEKQPLENQYVNWIGDIYKGKSFERKWRDYFFWDPYKEVQIESLSILCKNIVKEMRMSKEVIEHNTKINGIEKFEGIVTRSNFDSNFTDLSPAFDFEIFRNKIENV
jgi:N-acetyl-anhydromuramyl-L-alanine amidase AmpD